MKVLVPIDVETGETRAAALNAILDSAWPDDVEFYLLNVIENEPLKDASSCEGCTRCQCLEPRIAAITDVLRKLESKMPAVRAFVEVAKGDLKEKIQAFESRYPGAQILIPKPARIPTSHRPF
jgi:hypothetical protein